MSLYYHDSLDFTAVYNERLLCPGTDSSVMRLFLTDVCKFTGENVLSPCRYALPLVTSVMEQRQSTWTAHRTLRLSTLVPQDQPSEKLLYYVALSSHKSLSLHHSFSTADCADRRQDIMLVIMLGARLFDCDCPFATGTGKHCVLAVRSINQFAARGRKQALSCLGDGAWQVTTLGLDNSQPESAS